MARFGRRFLMCVFLGLTFVGLLNFELRIIKPGTRVEKKFTVHPITTLRIVHVQMDDELNKSPTSDLRKFDQPRDSMVGGGLTPQLLQKYNVGINNNSGYVSDTIQKSVIRKQLRNKAVLPVSTKDEWQLVCNETRESKPHFQMKSSSETVAAPDDKEGYDQDMDVPSWSMIYSKHARVEPGGSFTPNNSIQNSKMVIIVPYRDRRVHLKIFLDYMHAFLQRQNADYVIYVVEMESTGLFQRGTLLNIGFLEVMKRENTSCVIFHDVDILPIYDTNMYYCDETIRHYVAYRTPAKVLNFTLRLRSKEKVQSSALLFGGVGAFPVQHFRAVNGFSNLFSGWGGEDDEMLQRVFSRKIPETRLRSAQFGYYVLSHLRQPELKNRRTLVKRAGARMDKDGLSSVRYDVQVIEKRKLFTWILITIKPPSCFYPGFEEQFVAKKFMGFTSVNH